MWTDGQTDGEKGMTKLTVAFCNFANARKDDMENYIRKKGTVNWADIAGQSCMKEREAAVRPGEWIHRSVWPAQRTDEFGTILTVSGNAAISVRYELNFNIIRLNFRLQRGKFKDTAQHCTAYLVPWKACGGPRRKKKKKKSAVHSCIDLDDLDTVESFIALAVGQTHGQTRDCHNI
jgi:hypothetical protein